MYVAREPRRSLAVLAIVALVCLALFALLGVAAIHGRTEAFDGFAAGTMFGFAPQAAAALAQTGYTPWLIAASIVAFVIVRMLGGSWWLPLVVIGTQLVSQGLVEAIKDLIRRPRPGHFFGMHELGFSYPSGHATTAVVFYGFWAVLLASAVVAPKWVRIGGCTVLVLWGIALDISRVALGAHYASDVVGGNLIGSAFLALALIGLRLSRRTTVVLSRDRV